MVVSSPEKANIDDNRAVVYKKGKMINDQYYIVEMSYNEYNFFICAFDIETSNTMVRTMSSDNGTALMNGFD